VASCYWPSLKYLSIHARLEPIYDQKKKARTNPYPVPVVSSPIPSSSAAATGARAVWPAAKLLSAPASRRRRLRPPLRHAGPLACFVLTIQSPAVYRGGAAACACSSSPSPVASRWNQQLACTASSPKFEREHQEQTRPAPTHAPAGTARSSEIYLPQSSLPTSLMIFIRVELLCWIFAD
jgi:hypothetical protein